MYDTCIAFVVDECPDAVSDESLDGFKVLDSRSRSSGLKSDEFQRCPDSMVIGSFFPGKKWQRAKKEICWDPRIFGWMESQDRKAWRKT